MQIKRLLFAMGIALAATAAPVPPPNSRIVITDTMLPLVEDSIHLLKRGGIEIPNKWICESDPKTPDGPYLGWLRANIGKRPSDCEWGQLNNDPPPPPKSQRYNAENNPDLHEFPQ